MTQGGPARGPQEPGRSRRQERLSARADRRAVGGREPAPRLRRPGILVWTGVAFALAAVVVAAAFLASRPGDASSSAAPMAPAIVTPSGVPASGRTLGSSGAPTTIDLYSDFRCTACFVFYSKEEPQVVSNLVATGKARLVYRDFPTIDALDAQAGVTTSASRDAANAGLCAADEGAFWRYHDWLFANQDPREDPAAFSKARLIAVAKAAGVDDAAFEACVSGGTHDAEVAAEQAAAPSGVSGTPAIFVDGVLVSASQGAGYIPSYADIAAAVAKSGQSAAPSAAP